MNSYFNDKYLHTIDPKGRLLLPKDIRDHFKIKKSDPLYLVPNMADPPYLEIRSAALWRQYRESLRQHDPGEKKKNSFRYAMMLLETATADGQGRIFIPQRIRDICALDGTVAVINMDLYIEVWSKGNMERKYPELVRAFRDVNDHMF
jgi:DNA-binding transcriptional regulator/RsmH inhibitor MraZ